MKRNKHLLLLLVSATIFSCNNQQTNEGNNTAASDSVKILNTDKAITPDTIKISQQSDFVLEPSSNSSTITTKQVAISTESLSDIYKKLDKTPQNFSLKTSRDTTIIGAEGTTVKIKAKSFISEKTGKEIAGNIQISIKEYYKLSDILFAKLSTTTDGNLLETGGMIYITASANKEKCILNQGQTMEIGFPVKKRKNDMQLYSGDWKNDSQINWELVPNSKDMNMLYVNVEQMPGFPGGQEKMREFINKSIIYPVRAKQNGIQGTVVVTFTVSKDGSIQDKRVERGIDPECDQAALDLIGKMPRFIPGKEAGQPVNVRYKLPITFSLGDGSGYNPDYKKYFDSTYTDATIKNARTYQISKYLFSTSTLGWINCDRLWKDSSAPSVKYIVQLNSQENCNSSIVFHHFKAIMNGTPSGSSSWYANIPSGEQITLIAIKYINDKPYLAVKETQTSSQREEDLVFQPVTMETLKSEMKKLDRFN